MRVAVIGAGSWGVWTALELQAKGIDVHLYDQWGAGNQYAGSGGYTRIIRMVYGADKIYSELTNNSFEKWESLFRYTGENHYKQTGVLWLQSAAQSQYLEDSQKVLSSMGFPLIEFSLEEAREKWPIVNFEGIHRIFFEKRAGILDASMACKLALYKYIEEGGEYHNEKVASNNGKLYGSNGEITADKYVLAAGSWTRALFPKLLEKITYVSRQEVFFYEGGDISASNLPIWSDLESDGIFFYGFPPHREQGFKMAYDSRDVPMDPDLDPRLITDEIEGKSRDYMVNRFPGMKTSKLSEYRVCHYDNSIDGNFIIDFHPENSDILLMTGSSGHGFKMGPSIGSLAAEHLLDKRPIIDKFAIQRFKTQAHRSTQFN